MRLAFFLDNRSISSLGSLPDPALGNPGIGGTEYAFLAVVRALQEGAVQPLLFLTASQAVGDLDTIVVEDLASAIIRAEASQVEALVFRPLALRPADWRALSSTTMPMVAWLHNLGCAEQARFESLPNLRWVLVSGAQLDFFRHSRLSQRATVIANPVAVTRDDLEPRSWAEAQSALDLAYVGALTPFKGFDRLALSWASIARRCPDSRLRVFGGTDLYGPKAVLGVSSTYEQYCRDLLRRSGFADRVVFEGRCGLERYSAYHGIAVGVVNPSGRDETFCLSAAEFSACGIPVVTARRHALVQTVLHGQTGLLARSDRELADHCVALIQNPQWAWQLGLAGHKHVHRRFNPDQVRADWLALVAAIRSQQRLPLTPVSTPLNHEHRWLRQLWGWLLVLPGWPSWPSVKVFLKRFTQGHRQQLQPQGVAVLVAAVVLLVWILVVAGKFGGNPSGLARIGDQLPLSPRLAGQEVVILQGKRGNDGQQFLSLALDPLQREATTTATLDNPVYRGKRVLYPLLAWMLGLGQPHLILWSMGLINAGCMTAAAWLVARWALLHQRSPAWGLAVLSLPGYWITLSLNTADLLATTLMLSAAVAWKQQHLGRLWSSLAAALLTRETAALAWASSIWAALKQRAWRLVMPLVLVPLPWLVWTTALSRRFPSVTDQALVSLHFGWPLLGIFRKAGKLLWWGSPVASMPVLERLFDALSFGLWLSGLALLIRVMWTDRYGSWLRSAATLYGLTALCTTLQILARFPDYTRVWIDLSSLVLLAAVMDPSRVFKLYLIAASVVSLGYWVGFALMAP